MKATKQQPRRKERDLLDKIEDFIEHRIEHKIKKGLDDIEGFLKRELKELKQKAMDKDAEEDEGLSYLKVFLKDRKVASVAPSSKYVVAKVLKRMDLRSTKTVIEYGPAEGVVTKPILAKLPPDGRLVGVELNPLFAEKLSENPDKRLTVIRGSVTDVDKLVAPLNLGGVDVIVSGIPFSFLTPKQRHELLHKTVDLLRPGGRFIAYQVTTHLVPLLKYHFDDVDIDFEVRNLPPNFIFTGYK